MFQNLAVRAFSGLSHRRNRRRPASTACRAETFEQRLLLTEYTGPLKSVFSYGDNVVAIGETYNTDGIWDIQINVDIGNDGTVEHTVTSMYSPEIGCEIWEFMTGGAGDEYAGYDIAFQATGKTGSVDDFQDVIGNKVVGHIQLTPSNPPVLTWADSMNGLIWGHMTDDSLGDLGEYSIEVSQTSAETGFTPVGGEFPSDGNWIANGNWPNTGDDMTIWVRILETTEGFTLLSNVVQVEVVHPPEEGEPMMGGSEEPPPPGEEAPEAVTESSTMTPMLQSDDVDDLFASLAILNDTDGSEDWMMLFAA